MDEDEVTKKPVFEIGSDLAELSVEEINETIELLKSEIERLSEAAKAKSDHLSAAEALFKS